MSIRYLQIILQPRTDSQLDQVSSLAGERQVDGLLFSRNQVLSEQSKQQSNDRFYYSLKETGSIGYANFMV